MRIQLAKSICRVWTLALDPFPFPPKWRDVMHAWVGHFGLRGYLSEDPGPQRGKASLLFKAKFEKKI